ncbi:hypothetical protein D3C80_1823300 [compost metagenome]
MPADSPAMAAWSAITTRGAKALVAASPSIRNMPRAGDRLLKACCMLLLSMPR